MRPIGTNYMVFPYHVMLYGELSFVMVLFFLYLSDVNAIQKKKHCSASIKSAYLHQETSEKRVVKEMQDIYIKNETEKESKKTYSEPRMKECIQNLDGNLEGNVDNRNGTARLQ